MSREVLSHVSLYKEYVFDPCYRKQLESILDKRLFYINDCYEKRRLIIPGTEITQEVLTPVIRITINRSDLFLFAHCQLELIQQCLAYLEKNPESCKLFGDLAEYIGGHHLEHNILGVWLLLNMITLAILFFIVPPLSAFILVCGLASMPLLVLLAVDALGSVGAPGLWTKFVERVRDLIKDTRPTLKELEQNLTALIKDDKIKEIDEGVVNKQAKTCQIKEGVDSSQVTEEVTTKAQSSCLYPSLKEHYSSSIGFHSSPVNGSTLVDQDVNVHDAQYLVKSRF